jgi:hypothetical protein
MGETGNVSEFPRHAKLEVGIKFGVNSGRLWAVIVRAIARAHSSTGLNAYLGGLPPSRDGIGCGS